MPYKERTTNNIFKQNCPQIFLECEVQLKHSSYCVEFANGLVTRSGFQRASKHGSSFFDDCNELQIIQSVIHHSNDLSTH